VNSPGLRERKKQRTRDALVDAAYKLFQRKGFDMTTVEEIAESVDVSPRTFFRYFTSKEDIALAPLDQQLAEFLAALAARPAEEPVITALRSAAVGVVRAYETSESSFERDRHRSMQVLLAETPTLMAACLGQSTARLDELARLIAERLGVDPRADPRPYLVASVALSAVRTTVNAWQEIHPATPTSELLCQAFDLLTAGLNYPAARRSP
jgi:AcrR family transcriptional regulator